MKLPKKFDKMSNEDKRKWVADRLKIVRAEEQALTKLSQLLVRDEKFTIKVDDRPDLEYAKEKTN